MKNKKGFTLVELLAVIVLISLIMVLVVPQVQKVALQSKIKLCKSKVTLAEEALNLWVQDNYKCITTTDNCGMFSECSYNESSNEYTCKTTFSLLAKNNIVNYDKKIKDINYIINPINNGNMNDLIFNVSYNPVTKKVSTETNNKVETEICSSNSINEPIDTKESTTKTTITTSGTTNPSNTTSTTIPTTSPTESKYKLIINNPDGKFNKNTIPSEKYRTGTVVTIKLSFLTGYELDSYKCQNATCQQNGSELLVTIGTSDAIVTINSREILACNSFATDSWAMIQKNIQNNNSSCYKVGDTRSVKLAKLGTFTVRVSNNSNYDCSLQSKTACGFVVEFVDVIEKRQMHYFASNLNGWTKADLRTYLNGEFKNNILPQELSDVIISTHTVSGYGKDSYRNFEADDYVYLLNAAEVWRDSYVNTLAKLDTSYNYSRQLDYYKSNNVYYKDNKSCNNHHIAGKTYNGKESRWWLRSATNNGTLDFLIVADYGYYMYSDANNENGISPAFRIG